MQFPLSEAEITLWLGATVIILLVTSEIISTYYGRIGLLINKRNLRRITLVFFILFLLDIFIKVYEIFTY